MNKDCYSIYDTSLSFVNNTESNGPDWHRQRFHHYALLHRVFNMLRNEGFEIEKDKNVHKVIRKSHFVGRRGDLELHAERYPRGFKIEFFQNVSFENSNGGRYDFEKFQKMPYLIRLQYIKYMNKIVYIVNQLEDLAPDQSRLNPKLAEEWIKARYVEEWHHEQKDMNFNLTDTDGEEQPLYNGLDRDKKVLRNGDIKYFRHWNGYLYRGRVYHNINNMWWVIVDKYTVRNIAAFDLFDLTPEDNLHRMKDPTRSEGYKKHIANLEKLKAEKTKELVIELKRRGYAVKIERK